MRRSPFVSVGLVSIALLTLTASTFACRTTDTARLKDDTTEPPPPAADDPVADAKKVLAIIGGVEGSRNLCGQACHADGDDGAGGPWHAVTENLVVKWGNNLHRSQTCMETALAPEGSPDPEKALAEVKIKCLKAGANFSGPRMGFMRAALHHTEFKQLFQKAYGETWEAEHKKLEAKIMPSEAALEKMSEADYAVIKAWVKKYRPTDPTAFWPGLRVALGGSEGAKPCVENVSDEFVQYLQKNATDKNSWDHENLKNGVAMYGCPRATSNYDFDKSPLECFTAKKTGTTEDQFPLSSAMPQAATWLTKEAETLKTSIRILRELPYNSTYWVRSSADGRYVGLGVGGPGSMTVPPDLPFDVDGGLGAIEDLVLTDRPRVIVNASYDPGFFPDNKGFTFHGTGAEDQDGGAVFCNQTMLGDPAKKFIEFGKETKFCAFSTMSVYQHVGASLDGSGYYVIRSDDYTNDDGANSETRDPTVESFMKEDAVVEIWPMGEDEQKFKVDAQPITLKFPFEGDWTVSSTARLTTARLAGLKNWRPAQQGYRIRKFEGAAPTLALKEMATVCLDGGKAGFSYDERTLTAHHYVDADDFAELGFADASVPEFTALVNKASNIYVYDFLKKQKVRVTNMKPNQFALYPHFRSDGWLYFVVRDMNEGGKEVLAATDAAIRLRTAR